MTTTLIIGPNKGLGYETRPPAVSAPPLRSWST